MIVAHSFVILAAIVGSVSAMFDNPKFAVPATANSLSKQARSPMFDNANFTAPSEKHGQRSNLMSRHSRLSRRETPAAPHFVLYWDQWVNGQTGLPDVSQVQGYNVMILSFLVSPSQVADQATQWSWLTADQRKSAKAQYNNAGVKLMVSAFGATIEPTTAGLDPVATANWMAQWVLDYNLDGIDVDYEDFTAINRRDGSAENWLITFTKTLRQKLPQGQYIITHAPVAPWFAKDLYASGAYWKVDNQVGSLIDWYNIQFYNQGTSEYTTCDGLLVASSSTFPKTAVFQLATSGIPLNKIVIGKPATGADAVNGYIAPSTLAQCLQTAKGMGWSAGAMAWQFPNAGTAWVSTVRSLSWPVGSISTPPATSTAKPVTPSISSTTQTKPTTTVPSKPPAPTTTTGSGGSCSGISQWNADVAYTGGQLSVFGGHKWTAKWWTRGDKPGSEANQWSAIWTDNGTC